MKHRYPSGGFPGSKICSKTPPSPNGSVQRASRGVGLVFLYSGVAEAITEGKDILEATCRGCHGTEGAGGMGPALDDDDVRHARAATDKGKFEIIYGGAAGAMQPFGKRIDQDEILRVMAFLETLRTAE